MRWTRSLDPGVDPAMAEDWPEQAPMGVFPGFLVWWVCRWGGRLRLGPPNEGSGSGDPMPARESGDGGEGDAERIG